LAAASFTVLLLNIALLVQRARASGRRTGRLGSCAICVAGMAGCPTSSTAAPIPNANKAVGL
jgi:hypothetical protein